MARPKRDDKTKDLFAYAEDNRPSIVYMATNTVNGKRYIGITRLPLEKRWRAHVNEAKCGRQKHTSRLYRAIRRYGEDAFTFSILQHCDSFKAAAAAEIRLIAALRPEYNLSSGGEGIIGHRHNDAIRKKMSEARLRNPNRYWLGKKRPDIAELQRIRLTGCPPRPMLGKHHTEATKAKLRAAKIGKWTEQQRIGNFGRRKPIICVNDGRIFLGGVKEAATTYGFRYDVIMRVLRGGRPAHRRHSFQYYEAPE